MLKHYKNINRQFCCLLLTVSMCLTNIQQTIAQDSFIESRPTPLRGMVWFGNASWYGPRFHGKKTSNGERFNKHELTAAHRTLPFNTKVLVTNLKNNRSVIVRINDRGPFIDDRIIDLSEEAANMIDGKKDGISYIKLQVIPG